MADTAAAPTLRQLQRQLFGLIRAVGGAPAGLVTTGLREADVERVVVGDARLSALGRVDVYADMYFSRLIEVLRGTFPRLSQLLGDEGFTQLCTNYLDACPSRHRSLRNLGDRLADFIRDAGGAGSAAALEPWAADLAALEWHRSDVFDEADAPVLLLAEVQGLAPEAFASLAIHLIPAHRLFTPAHEVQTVWRALKRGEAIEPPLSPARPLLVWRQDALVYHRPVAATELPALALARVGTTFGVICDLVAGATNPRGPGPDGAAFDPAVAEAFALLARWVNDGLLVGAAA